MGDVVITNNGDGVFTEKSYSYRYVQMKSIDVIATAIVVGVILCTAIPEKALSIPMSSNDNSCAYKSSKLSSPMLNFAAVVTRPDLFFNELISMVQEINKQSKYKEEFVKSRGQMLSYEEWACRQDLQAQRG